MPASINRVQSSRSMEITWGYTETPAGTCLLAATAEGVCWLDLQPCSAASARLAEHWSDALLHRDDAAIAVVFANVQALLAAGQSPDLQVKSTDFQLQVWRAMQRIPAGDTWTYAQLARRIRHPRAARAVGSAAAANTIALLIPCHRLVPASGGYGRYRWGENLKRSLLQVERATGQPAGITRADQAA